MSDIYLCRVCEEGLWKWYGELKEVYIKCLDYELNVIFCMGFSDYFFIVWDFMKYVYENYILIGLGCGLVVGLFVLYVLEIIDIDLIEYDLLFERFLNFECVMFFDIDIDFLDVRCDEMICYVKDKYG